MVRESVLDKVQQCRTGCYNTPRKQLQWAVELSHRQPPQLWVHITEVSDRKETEQWYAGLLTAGGADGDLDAHLEGKRRFAGRAGREKPFPLEDFAGADT